jgi:hypothetical protein
MALGALACALAFLPSRLTSMGYAESALQDTLDRRAIRALGWLRILVDRQSFAAEMAPAMMASAVLECAAAEWGSVAMNARTHALSLEGLPAAGMGVALRVGVPAPVGGQLA